MSRQPRPTLPEVPSGTQAGASDPPDGDQAVWILDDGSKSPFGPVERQLREDIGELKLQGQLSGTVTATAYNLARALDRGAGMATAAVARELREYIRLIEGAAGDDADTSSHRSDLSTPV